MLPAWQPKVLPACLPGCWLAAFLPGNLHSSLATFLSTWLPSTLATLLLAWLPACLATARRLTVGLPRLAAGEASRNWWVILSGSVLAAEDASASQHSVDLSKCTFLTEGDSFGAECPVPKASHRRSPRPLATAWQRLPPLATHCYPLLPMSTACKRFLPLATARYPSHPLATPNSKPPHPPPSLALQATGCGCSGDGGVRRCGVGV